MPKRTRTPKPTAPEAAAAVQAAAEWVPADSLVEWEGNPRTNQPVEDVAQSIWRFGFGAPIVARRANRQIIAGHTRLKAFRFCQQHVLERTRATTGRGASRREVEVYAWRTSTRSRSRNPATTSAAA